MSEPRGTVETSVKDWLQSSRAWSIVRAYQSYAFEHSYRKRRDSYYARLKASGLQYREGEIILQIRKRLGDRGYTPKVKRVGELRTLSVVGETSWHQSLLRGLGELGETINCDYTLFKLQEWNLRALDERRRRFNEYVLDVARREHKIRPFDWLFAYVNGRYVLPETLQVIHEELGIPTVNLWLDDKNRWSTVKVGSQNCGQIDIANAFDMSWTSSTLVCGWYLAEGGRPIYLPEGCDASEYYPRTSDYDIPISFLGSCYGCRPAVVRFWRKHGMPVRVFGRGWGSIGEYADSPASIFSRSQINMGIGGMGESEVLTNVKGRDFEVACTGGGVYLTAYNADLAGAFDVGKEILCYGSRDEAIEIAFEYLDKPELCQAIARRARDRCIREHKWSHRFIHVCRILGIAGDK